MDISMPGQGGLAAICHIKQRRPAAKILVFSMHQHPSFAIQATQAGALGYVTKSSEPDVLIFELLEKTESRRQLAKLRDSCPQAKLLAFTGNTSLEDTVIALDCGAAGLLTKNCTPDEIRSAILKLDQGDNYLEARIAMRVVAHLRTAEARRKEAQALRLTVREEQVVKCLMEGMTNLQIANRLMISEKTVKHYVGCLKEKFSANNRLEIVLYAQRVALV